MNIDPGAVEARRGLSACRACYFQFLLSGIQRLESTGSLPVQAPIHARTAEGKGEYMKLSWFKDICFFLQIKGSILNFFMGFVHGAPWEGNGIINDKPGIIGFWMGVPSLQFSPCRLFNGLQGAAAVVQIGIHRATKGRDFSGKVRLAECNDRLHDLIFLSIGLFMRRD